MKRFYSLPFVRSSYIFSLSSLCFNKSILLKVKQLLFLSLLFMLSYNLQAQTYVEGSIKVDGAIKNIQVEQVGDMYRLCTPFFGLNQEEFTVCTLVEFNELSDNNTTTPCNEEFTENCEARIENANCSWNGLCANDLSVLPIATLNTSNFGDVDEICINRISNLHFFSLQSLYFLRDILEINPPIGKLNNYITSTYSTRQDYENSSIIRLDACDNTGSKIANGAKMFSTGNRHYIGHEWGHVVDNYISVKSSDFLSGIGEGMADIWSNAIILYYENNENINNFILDAPRYNLPGLKYRDWEINHFIYGACSIDMQQTSLPNGHELLQYFRGKTNTHGRGGVLRRWFYLTAEGTNNQEYYVSYSALKKPRFFNLLSPLNHACNSDEEAFEQETETRRFSISGIGHWKTTQILKLAEMKANMYVTGSEMRYDKIRETTIKAAIELFQNDPNENYCDILRQVTESWYSVNVGDKMTATITAPDIVCKGYPIEIVANHITADAIKLYHSNDLQNPIAIGITNPQGEGLILNYSENTDTETSPDEFHFVLKSDVSEIDGITLPSTCTLNQDIYVTAKKVLLSTDMDKPCINDMVALTAEAHPASNVQGYEWKENGVIIPNESDNQIEISKSSAGTFEYSVDVSFLTSTGNTLIETIYRTVEFVNPPSLKSNAPSTNLEFCTLDNSNISKFNALDYVENVSMIQILNIDGNEMQGTPVNESTNEVNVGVSFSGIYTIIGTNGNCPSIEVEITVQHVPIEAPIITVFQQECNPGGPIQLQASGVGLDPDTFEWYENNGTEPIGYDALLSNITQPGTYTFRAYDTEGCPTEATYEVGVVDLGIEGNHIITGDVTWDIHANQDETITIDGTIRILGGGTLTIANGANVEFVNHTNGRIIVEEGGKLIGNNVSFRTSDCVNYDIWQGMQVLGDPESEHSTENQGIIDLTGGLIEDALVGILVGEQVPNSIDYIGGGQVLLNNVKFENNHRGIIMRRTNHNQDNKSEITNCRFINSAAFENNPMDPLGKYPYRHIELRQLATPFKMVGNTFETKFTSGLTIEQKGTAIHIVESAYRIGEQCVGNTFINVYRGVDVVSNGAALAQNISNNEFTGVNKGITLNNTTATEVLHNEFKQIPEGTSFGDISHGLLLESAAICIVQNNLFETLTSGTKFKRGMVIRNTQFQVNGPEFLISHNTFNGSYPSATQFEQNNTNLGLTINCHDYNGNPNEDWYLHTDCVLPTVGNCVNNAPTIAYRGSWHDENNGTGHVLDASGTLTAINYRNEKPDVIDNPTIAQSCGEPSTCTPIICIGKSPPTPPTHPITPEKERRYVVQQVQYKLATEDYTGAILELEQRQEVWSDKILAANYLQKADNAQALQTLNRIPTNRSDDLAFVNMMTALAQEQLPANESMIRYYAADMSLNPRTNVLAESLLSAYFDEDYIRNAAPMIESSSKTAPNFLSKIWLQFLPNPAKDQLTLQWIEIPKEEVLEMTIFNGFGQKAKSLTLTNSRQVTTIPLEGLEGGIYYVQVKGNENIYSFEKIVVIK